MEDTFSRFSFPYKDATANCPSKTLLEIENILNKFVGNWRRSLEILLPMRSIGVTLRSIEVMTFAEFVQRKSEPTDFQVFEIQALENLCVWGLDIRLVSVVVDCMFGGQGFLPSASVTDRAWTPIEQKIRWRLWESLANAYEAPWQTILPQRMRLLRDEKSAQNLRLAQSQTTVYVAEFSITLNQSKLTAVFCLPTSPQLQLLWSEEALQAGGDAVWGSELRQTLKQTPLEARAVIANQTITVGQLLQFGVGQVVPIDLGATADVQVEGRTVVSGRYGVKNGHYAVKIERVWDELDRLMEQQPPSESAPSSSEEEFKEDTLSGPLKSAVEALDGFDQKEVPGGEHGQN